MEEFGTPEELAQSIISKFASVPMAKFSKNEKSDGTYSDFGGEKIKNLDIAVGTAEVVLTAGEKFCVDYRGLSRGDIRCSLSPFGTLTIENSPKLPNLDFFSHSEKQGANHPRILIKVPQNSKFDVFRLHVGAGSFVTKNISVSVGRTYVDVGAGNIELKQFFGGSANFHCGMGRLCYAGTLTGLIKIDCGMGFVGVKLTSCNEDFSINAKVGLGEAIFNETKKSGFGILGKNEQRKNHFSVNVGMGKVSIQTKNLTEDKND